MDVWGGQLGWDLPGTGMGLGGGSWDTGVSVLEVEQSQANQDELATLAGRRDTLISPLSENLQ